MDTEVALETQDSLPIEDQCWYQPTSGGGRYWHQNTAGRWIFRNRTQFSNWLQTQGLMPFIPKEDRGDRILSQVDELMTMMEGERIIDYAGGLAGWRAGVYSINRSRVLVTEDPDLITPVAEHGAEDWWGDAYGFPVLAQFLEGLFNGVERDGDVQETVEQLPRFLDWLQHFLKSLYDCQYSTGTALALAGEPESGKTLLAQIITRLAGGVVAKPYRYMVGQDNFNEEWLGASILLVDDENSNTHIQERLRFATELKQIVATRGIRIRAMHQKAVVLTPIQRLLVCVNLEPERLQVLPPIDGDIRDKIMVLKGYAQPMPMPTRTPGEQQDFWSTIEEELPHFLHWLLYTWQPDENEMGRFGPRAWQHPQILEELGRLNPEARTEEFIDRWMEKDQPRIYAGDVEKLSASDRSRLEPLVQNGGLPGWVGTVSELRAELVADGEDAPLSMLERREVRAVAYLGRDLAALSRKYPGMIWQSRKTGGRQRNWVILPEEVQ